MSTSHPSEKQIKQAMLLKEAILESYDPEAIILFGSLGRGDADEFSDVDFLVVMETDRDVNEISTEITGELDRITTDKHIIVRTPMAFSRQQDIPGTIAFSAAKEGKVLFTKNGWQIQALHNDPYNVRKKEVLQQEYIQTAHDFLSQAESSCKAGNFFRCRDFARFASARAIKGVFVDHNIHPPRETDLVNLINQAKKLEPRLERHIGFLHELNDYIPDNNDASGDRNSCKVLQKTTEFVRHVISTYMSETLKSAPQSEFY